MNLYTIFYKIDFDGRAPERPPSDQYEHAGQFQALSKKQAYAALARSGVEAPLMHQVPRALRIGDVLVDPSDAAWILTSQLQWALVEFDPAEVV